MRDEAEYRGDSAAVDLGVRRCRDAEGVSALNDPRLVRDEYADERGLATRMATQVATATGPDPYDVVFGAVADCNPQLVLEVGCGSGELSGRMAQELDARVVGLDQSERMVELTRQRRVEAIVGDVQDLPFKDGIFDCAVAAWMLYHAWDLGLALRELRRVIRDDGRVVAAASGERTFHELWQLVGEVGPPAGGFSAENAEWALLRHFTIVQRRDIVGTVTFADHEAAYQHMKAVPLQGHLAERLPFFDEPLVATRNVVVFVAEP